MVSRTEILRQAGRRYPALLQAIVTGEPVFPVALKLGKTLRAKEYEDRKAELQTLRLAARDLAFEVQWTRVSDPRFGAHERPEAAWFADEGSFLSALGKTEEVARFRQDIGLIRKAFPGLESWLAGNARRVVENQGRWPRLLRAIAWMIAEPASGLYLRQLPIRGVDTKFMEMNLPILDELLCHLNPARREPADASFRGRHGLREEESTVRLRFLDHELRARCSLPEAATDLSLPLSAASLLPLDGTRVFVTENLRNFLALPGTPGALVIHGHGDAASRLNVIPWLGTCQIFYWGDIDARGFAILARFRAFFPQTQSLMMDQEAFNDHAEYCGQDNPAGATVQLEHLTLDEQVLLNLVIDTGMRLEQERIAMDVVTGRVSRADWGSRRLVE